MFILLCLIIYKLLMLVTMWFLLRRMAICMTFMFLEMLRTFILPAHIALDARIHP